MLGISGIAGESKDYTGAVLGLLDRAKIVPGLTPDCWAAPRLCNGWPKIAGLSEDCAGVDPGLLECPSIVPWLARDCLIGRGLCRD